MNTQFLKQHYASANSYHSRYLVYLTTTIRSPGIPMVSIPARPAVNSLPCWSIQISVHKVPSVPKRKSVVQLRPPVLGAGLRRLGISYQAKRQIFLASFNNPRTLRCSGPAIFTHAQLCTRGYTSQNPISNVEIRKPCLCICRSRHGMQTRYGLSEMARLALQGIFLGRSTLPI